MISFCRVVSPVPASVRWQQMAVLNVEDGALKLSAWGEFAAVLIRLIARIATAIIVIILFTFLFIAIFGFSRDVR